jgi:glycosyltransferase involved in cell wall biosynthesis
MSQTSLTVIVPVFNEVYLVEESLRRLHRLQECDHLDRIQIIVVDDGSGDGTAEVLSRFAANLPADDGRMEWLFVDHDTNRGKGRAIQTALAAAVGEITIIHDADLEYDPRDIQRMIPLFLNENADAVFGSRFMVHEYRRVLLFRHEIGNRFLTFVTNWVTNLNLSDMETCYKAVKTGLLKSIPIRSNDFRIEPELTIKLAKRNARIFEIPINYSGRTYQEGKKIQWKDGLKALWAILRFGFADDVFVEDREGGKILNRLGRADRFNGWMAATIRPYIGQNVLEIGSGIGNLTRKLIPRKAYQATDINAFYLQIMNNMKVDKPYLTVSFLDLNDVSEMKRSGQRYDTVICLNVIEHLEDDMRAMRNIADLTDRGGRAIVLVPQSPALYGSLDSVLGHKRRYDQAGLRRLAAESGFRVNAIIPFNRISSIPWYINGRILKKETFGLPQMVILNLFTPIFRRIDRFLPFTALSLIAVLEKDEPHGRTDHDTHPDTAS